MLTLLKKLVEKRMEKLALILHKIGLSPNQISASGFLLAIVASVFYWAWSYDRAFLAVAATLLLISGACDVLDGAVARLNNEVTIFGGFFDSILDRYSDAVIFSALIVSNLCDTIWGILALSGSLVVSYARARAESEQVGMETVGVAERAERMIVLVISSFVAFLWLEAINWAVIILAVLTNL